MKVWKGLVIAVRDGLQRFGLDLRGSAPRAIDQYDRTNNDRGGDENPPVEWFVCQKNPASLP
jgi:hypothetical protein